MTQQVIVPENGKTLLERYGSRKELREFADRITRSIPVNLTGGQIRPMKPAEAMHLAEASLAHGLDPFVGQVYMIVDKEGVPKIHIGPAGYEVAATRQLHKEGGGNWWPEYEAINNSDERGELLVPIGAVAYRCKLYDTPSIKTYVEAIKAATAAGASWDEIKATFGSRPYTEGLGFYKPKGGYQDEMYSPHHRARKRALNNALRQRFSLEFHGESDGDLPDEFTGPLLSDRSQVVDQSPAPASTAPAVGQDLPADPDPGPAVDNAALDAEIAAADAAKAKSRDTAKRLFQNPLPGEA